MKVKQTFSGHTAAVSNVVIMKDADDNITVRFSQFLFLRFFFAPRGSSVFFLAFFPTQFFSPKKKVASASLDTTVRFWDLSANKMVNSLDAQDQIHSVYIYRNNTMITGIFL